MDSTRVEIFNKSLDRLVLKLTEHADKPSMWDTLTPLLIGAGLTLLTQFLIEIWKSKKEKKLKIQELTSKAQAKVYLISQLIKDLAMYKTHKQYYYRAFTLEIDLKAKDDFYKKHYEKGQEQRMTEAKLDENIAEYFQLVTEYMIVAKNQDDFNDKFKKIFNYEHPKSSKFTDKNTITELVPALDIEEKRLNTEYKGFRSIFESIQQSMT
jgi:hypothetical protein